MLSHFRWYANCAKEGKDDMRVYSLVILLGVVLFAGCSRKTSHQDNERRARLAEMINSKNFVFLATTAIPARGRTIQLTSTYTLAVKNDSLIANLPYFGRAFTAPIGQAGGGIEFISKDYTYIKEEKRNGAFEIEMIPLDYRDVRRLFLTISPSGYGNLYVTSQNRQAISFRGQVENAIR